MRILLPALRSSSPLVALFFGVILSVAGPKISSAEIRALEQGTRPLDCRLQPLKDLNGYFPFVVPKSVEEWKIRREEVRNRMLVSQGLWPLPEKTPMNPVIHGRCEFDGYSVEKVFFESLPGFYVTGSLFRPLNKTESKSPVVLCPHGHWANGRFYDKGENGVLRDIVDGAERFREGGRSPLQARCVQLARMGCIVFHYDMIGYADSQQLSYELVHRFAKQRPKMNDANRWGLFSPQAESRLQSVMGLQTWNSIRAVDFVEQLPDVDPKRIAVTGASGGGTQTFMLAAIDSRISVSVPAVMVSTAMQGGCTCENASCLRVGTGNVEMAGVFAPKPQLLIAAKDWTIELETKGFPELERLYSLCDAKQHIQMKGLIHFPHNYNYVNRATMYEFMNRHLGLGLKTPIVEQDYEFLSSEDLTVWNDDHPQPPGGESFETQLTHQLAEQSDEQLRSLRHNDNSLEPYRDVVKTGLDVVLGRRFSDLGDVEYEQTQKVDRGTYLLMAGVLRHKSPRICLEELPALFCYPKEWNGRVVIWTTSTGKNGLFTGNNLHDDVQRLVDHGSAVVSVDLLFQGEFLLTGETRTETRKVKNPREFAGYTFGYNHALFARRVHDLMTVVKFVKNHERSPKRISLVGLDETGPIVVAARAQLLDVVHSAAINTNGFRFANVDNWQDPYFLPGGAKYDDIIGMLTVAAPLRTWIAGEPDDLPPMLPAAFRDAGHPNRIVQYLGVAEQTAKHAVDWLLAD